MDERALREHADFLRGLARSLLRDEHLADDAVQDAYVAALRQGGASNLRAWLAAVTRNLSLRARRRRDGRRRPEQAAARREATPSTDELVVQAEMQQRVAQAVLDLEEPYRATVLLRYFHQQTPTEIARNQRLPVATVKTRLRRALERLRASLGDRNAWALALASLAGRGRDLPITFLGALAMHKTTLIAAGLLVALLAGGAITLATRGQRTVQRGEPGRHRSSSAAVDPTAAVETTRAATPESTSVEPETVSGREREQYAQWRQVAGALRSSREVSAMARKLFAELGHEPEPKIVGPDPAARAYLEELVAKYRTLAAGRERVELLSRLVATHRDYLAATGDTAFLRFLEAVIDGSRVDDERELAIPDGEHDAVTALLLRLVGHRNAVVRAGALRSLGPSFVSEIARGLEDKASAVRWTAAIQLEFVVAEPAHIDALLAGIGRETHPLAMDAMVRAVEALDPKDGPRHVAAAVKDASPAVRALTRGLPAAPSSPPRAAVAGERRPDEETRVYLERLLVEYRVLPEGDERATVLEKLVDTHADYLERTGDFSCLPAIRELPGEAVARSFRRASLPEIVDLLIDLTANRDADVRCAAATSLAWTHGGEAGRAHAQLMKCLADPDSGVRRVTAMLAGAPIADEANVPAVLAALAVETDFTCAYAMVGTVLGLDPERGHDRIQGAIERSPSATRDVVDRVLSMRERR